MPDPAGLITLTTDFGLDDTYVAQLHAVLLRACPSARVVDVTHAVPPGRLESACFLTETAWPQFPVGTVHVVVVDPGVGGARGVVAVETPTAWLVGPDTGVLSSGFPPDARPGATQAAPLPAGYRAVEISASPRRAAAVSPTFHGRDVMAPVAGALAGGAALGTCGTPVESVTLAPPLADAGPEARVLHIDHFGNVITSLRAAEQPSRLRLLVTTGWRDQVTVDGVYATYAAAPSDRPVCIAGSAGYLEIAYANDHAADRLGLRLGDALRVLSGRRAIGRG